MNDISSLVAVTAAGSTLFAGQKSGCSRTIFSNVYWIVLCCFGISKYYFPYSFRCGIDCKNGDQKNLHKRGLLVCRGVGGIFGVSGVEHRLQTAVDSRDGWIIR